ncbi:MAG: glycyl-radical enzyme activating protein [Terracidiphilus sp.]
MDSPPKNGAQTDEGQPLPAPPVGLVFNIMRFSLHDGPGIRTTVFLKGCPLRCRWCHNPESQSSEPEILYFGGRCIRCGDCVLACPHGALDAQLNNHPEQCLHCGECVEACPSTARQLVGRWMTVEKVLAEALKDEVFYEESGGGITISGGEPLQQADFVVALLAACKARRFHTVLDTCGFAAPDVLRQVSEHVDLFFYDLKLMNSEKHLSLTGVNNDLILQNLAMLAKGGSAIRVRVPILPGFNNDYENLDALSQYLSPLGIREIDLLPYHELGSGKYRRMNLSGDMEGAVPPTTAEMETIAARLRRDGFHVRIGD